MKGVAFSYFSLHNQPLAISKEGAEILIPLIQKAVSGESVTIDESEARAESYYTADGQAHYRPQTSATIAVYDIQGLIRAYGYYDETAVNVLKRYMLEAEADASVREHVIRLNTHGGDALMMFVAAEFIKTLKKRTTAFVEMQALSAGYGIASACTQIVAAHDLCRVGSIGIMATVTDHKKQDERYGLVVHEIYADGSEAKNSTVKSALEGDYEPYKKQYLNPIRERFVSLLKENRPQMTDTQMIGNVFFAQDTIGTMVDSIMPFENLMASLFATPLPAATNFSTNKNYLTSNSSNMKLFGLEISAVKSDNTVTLTAQEFDAIVAKSREEEAKAQQALIAEAIEKATAPLVEKIEALEKGQKFLDNTAGANPAKPNAPETPKAEETEDPIAAANKMFADARAKMV